MPLAALAVPALASAAAGAAASGIAAATGAGKSDYKATPFGQTSDYNPDAFKYQNADSEMERARFIAQNAGQKGATQLQTSGIAQARNAQAGALGLYEAAARGTGPSAAQAQLQAGLGQALSANASTAASARGGSLARAGAALAGQNQAASMMGQSANAAAILRAQEQQAGMAGYAGLANALRSADAQQAMYQAQLEEAQRARNLQEQQFYDQYAAQIRSAQQQGGIAQQQTLAGSANQANGINAQVALNNADANMRYLQAGIGAASGTMQGIMNAKPDTFLGQVMGVQPTQQNGQRPPTQAELEYQSGYNSIVDPYGK